MKGCDVFKVGDARYAEAARDFIAKMEPLVSTLGDRARSAANVAEEYKTAGDKYFAWAKSGPYLGLAGLMILSTQADAIKIEDICTHPHSKGIGTELVAFAVKKSIEDGKGGVIVLTDMSGSEFYDKLGFRVIDAGGIKKRLDRVAAQALLERVSTI